MAALRTARSSCGTRCPIRCAPPALKFGGGASSRWAEAARTQVDIDPIVKLGKDFPNEEVRLEQPGEAAPEAMECIKRTYQPSVRVRKRRHGFLSRLGPALLRRPWHLVKCAAEHKLSILAGPASSACHWRPGDTQHE